MVVSIKDAAKLIGISIIACCAVLVCTMFLNFYFDIQQIEAIISTEPELILYHAQVLTAKVVCSVSGGCLLITSVIMLLFYVKHYIDTHKKELGILKAMGYSNLKIAKNFWVFGVDIFWGAAAGYLGAFLIMPAFYALQNKDKVLPEISIRFHPEIFLYFVVLPVAAFSSAAIFYAWCKLKAPVLTLLNDELPVSSKIRKQKKRGEKDCTFLCGLKKDTLRTKKTLVFFMIFSSFCFSAMTQMSASMKDLSSVMMGMMILIIGIILACTTLLMTIITVIQGNTKTIAMMRVFGYSQKECCKSLLGGYRPLSYIGFALGTVYQYALLRIIVDIVFRNMEGVPVYKFDFPVMFISFVFFLAFYEIVMRYYYGKIKKITVKEIMIES